MDLDRYLPTVIPEAWEAVCLTMPVDGPNPEQAAAIAERNRLLRSMIESLGPADARLIIRRFGLDGREPATLSEIAPALGVTLQAVASREQRALKRLRPLVSGLS